MNDEATTDYETMSRADLMRLRAGVDKAMAGAADRDRRAALKAAEAAVREQGFTLAELMPLMGKGGSKGRRGKSDASVRYRNPDNPEQTWSGRGRRPGWFNEAQAAGRPLEDLHAG